MRTDGAPSVRAKVCGVTSPRDAGFVAGAGADYLGVILSPGFSRSVPHERAATIYAAAPAKRVGVFVDADPRQVASTARALALDIIQLSGSEPPGDAAEISATGRWRVWKTVHAKTGVSVAEAARPYAGAAHGILVDAWDPTRPGGAGRTFAWEGIGREVRDAIGSATFIAAGGMTPENAGAAVAALSPDVLDVSSGVESTPGAKDPERVRAFVEAVRRAGAGG